MGSQSRAQSRVEFVDSASGRGPNEVMECRVGSKEQKHRHRHS